MTSIEELWTTIASQSGGSAVFRLVDPKHPLSLYAGFDHENQRSLMLVTDRLPEDLPALGAVKVSASVRADCDYAIVFRLARPELNELFGQLCQDLVDATTTVSKADGTTQLLARLARWQRLLEHEHNGLSESELRGLFGELWFLREVAIPEFGVIAAVHGWNGPLDAAQDFQLASELVEVKTLLPGGHCVTISSANQLDNGESPLQLAVVCIHPSGELSVNELAQAIRKQIENYPSVRAEFDLRLAAAGFIDRVEYEKFHFSADEIRFYPVSESFPRLTSAQVPPAISRVKYELDLHQCGVYRSEFIHGAN